MSNVFHSAGVQATATCGATATHDTGPASATAKRPRSHGQVIKRKHAGLSFWTITETPRGRWISDDAFDVPPESYGDGFRTGYAVALELTNALRSQALSPSAAQEVMKAAFAVPRDPQGVDTLGRRGAACAFTSVVAALLSSAVGVLDVAAYIEGRLADSERGQEALEAFAAQAKAALLERMRVARAAKAAKAADKAADQATVPQKLYSALDPTGKRVLLPVGQVFNAAGVVVQTGRTSRGAA